MVALCGLSGGDDRSILRWPQRGVCLLRRRPPIHPVRQHQAGGCPDPGRWEAAANARLHGASVPLSVRGQVRPAGQGQRQGQGRGTGRLHPAELPGPRPACRELRGPQRCSRRTVPPAPGGAAAGHKETIGERLERDRQVLLPLPPAPYDACDKRPGRASSLSLVRYRSNDYSVPVAYGHREVSSGATSMRCDQLRGRGDRPAPPVLRQRGPDLRPAALPALDRAEDRRPRPGRAIGGLGPARGLHHSAAAPRSSYGQAGKREYVQVLRLLETFRLEEVEGASATPCGSAQSALMR